MITLTSLFLFKVGGIVHPLLSYSTIPFPHRLSLAAEPERERGSAPSVSVYMAPMELWGRTGDVLVIGAPMCGSVRYGGGYGLGRSWGYRSHRRIPLLCHGIAQLLIYGTIGSLSSFSYVGNIYRTL